MFGSAFNGLREHTLKRLYKFILKRVIGPYLESELLLEVSEILFLSLTPFSNWKWIQDKGSSQFET
jgi:hypothetical protein